MHNATISTVRSSRLVTMLVLTVAVATVLALTPTNLVAASCSLTGTVSTWSLGSSSNWYSAGNWTPTGAPNSSGTSVCITDGTSTVTMDTNTTTSVNNLQLASGNTLATGTNANLFIYGTQFINDGAFLLNGGNGANSILQLENNVTLSGTGTLTLITAGGGGAAYIDQGSGGLTLTNQSTIQGAGVIGNNGLSLINSGTVDANTSGQALTLVSMSSGINNTGGLLRASNGGILQLNGINVSGGGTITARTGGIVQLYGNTAIQGGTLNNIGGTLGTLQNASAYLDGSTSGGAITINGTYTGDVNTDTYFLGTINNKNNFQLNGGSGANAIILVDSSNVMLQGGGTVTLSTAGGGGAAYLQQASGGLTLTNVDNTIQGAGVIGNNGLTLVNEATVNANVASAALILESMSGGLTNTGILEASNGGILQINGVTVNNAGGAITANAGSTVQLYGNTMIQGGVLTNNGSFLGTLQNSSAYLDGSTTAGAITINGNYTSDQNTDTYLLGTINNKNNIFVNGGNGSNTILLIDTTNLTLQGGGTVTLSTAAGGGAAYIEQSSGGLTLTNVNNTLQGAGVIGNNGLTVVNEATINANVGGADLILTNMSGGLTNTGVVEASNGGILQINGVTVNNAGGGTITANAGSTVQLFGNTVIQGGSLTNNGAFFGVPQNSSVFLDGSTGAGAVTLNGTWTSDFNSDTWLLGTINNKNNFQVNGGSGVNTVVLVDSSNVTLQGGGTLTLSTTTGGGDAILEQASGGLTLTNVNNTIQGEGVLGNNGLTIINQATIDANSTGGAVITPLTIVGASVTNTGLIEATNSGILQINGVTVNNAGGNITANGGSASVQLYGNATIQGGTLTNNGGAFFGTPVSNSAYLDGSTGAGAVTINGTYTSDLNTTTHLRGTINNQGNIQVNGGSGNNTVLLVDSSTVTLTGGGTVTLSTAGGGGSAYIYQSGGGLTLDNFDNTIQGAGLIGNNGLSLTNEAGGTVLANATGQTLFISGAGTVTNNGTFQANSGSTLLVGSVTSFTNFSGNTLTGGTYNVYGTVANPGTLQINPLGNTGGEIVNNAATIYLNGPNSNVVDSAGLDALSNFSNNTSSGSFTITSGRNFTSPISTDFANAGAVIVGSGSTFTAGGVHSYVQSGGSTQLNGTLVPGPLFPGGGEAAINGGVLFGNGGTVIGGDLRIAGGTIAPAATINGSNVPTTAGSLSVNGIYIQNANGVFNLGLGGLAPGSQFGFLGVSGNAFIDGTLNVNLLNSYFPTVGDTFTFLTTGGTRTGTFAITNGLNIGHGEILNVVYGSNFIELAAAFLSTTDLWNGGTGVWSNGPQWSIGVPQPAFDTFIYSGGNDDVTMDVGSSTVNSLTVGGPSNGSSSILVDNGTAQTLVVTNGLTVGVQGALDFTGSGSSITAGNISNSGYVLLGPGVTLNLTNQPNGVTSVAANSTWEIAGNFAVGGVANTGFANLANLDGSVLFENGASQSITTPLTISGTGKLTVKFGAALDTAGISNSGSVLVLASDTLSMSGSLTNDGSFVVNGKSGMATMTGLINNAGGFVDVDKGATMTVNGNVTNNAGGPQGIYTGFNGNGNSTIQINGTLTNNGMIGLESSGDMFNVTGGVTNNSGALFALTGGSSATFSSTLLNNGQVDAENGSSLTVNGATTNSGTLSTSGFGGTGGNTITFNSLVTNNSGAHVDVDGSHDTVHMPGGLANSGFVVVQNGSTIDPPFVNNIGIINIDSTSTFVVGTGAHSGTGYIQLANGTLGEMISSSNFGQVFTGGDAALSGTLDILLQGGFNPSVGTTYDIILFSAGGLTGTFSTINNLVFNGGTEIWQINYDNVNGDVVLTAAATNPTVPEPGTFLMLGSGLIGIACSVRRRWLK